MRPGPEARRHRGGLEVKLLLEAKDPEGNPQEVEIMRTSAGEIYLMIDEWPSLDGSACAVRLTAVEAAQLCNGLREAFELDLPTGRKAPRYGVPR